MDSLLNYLNQPIPDAKQIETYNSLALELVAHDTVAARSYALKALDLANKINDTTGKALAYNRLGIIAYSKGKFSRAMEFYHKNLVLRMAQRDSSGIASTYLNMGNVHKRKGEYVEALDLYYRGLRYCRSNSPTDLRDLSSLHRFIAITLITQGNTEKGEEHYLQALFFSKKSGVPESLASTYLDIGNFNALNGDLQKALANYAEASSIMEKINDKSGLAVVSNSMGNVHLQKEEYESSRKMYSKSIELRKEIGDAHGVALGYNNMGTSYAWEGLHKKALEEFEKGGQIAMEAGLRDELARSWENSSYSYEALGEYKKAFLAYYSFDSISNILLNESNSWQINELQVQYDTEKKERQIESLQQKEALQQALAQKRETQMKAMLAGLALLLGLGAALVFAYRQKQKANALLNEQKQLVEKREKEKELLLRELNHRVKNNLQVIASMLSLQSFQLEDKKAVEAVKEGQSRVEAMFLIHERLYRDEQVTHIDMEHYINQLLNST
ncbi:MAG: tetratricopeptide repeat protein [Owenweeksia sp.]